MRGRVFTIVELMIVVAIVAILAGIGLPEYREMQYKAKAAEVPLLVDGIMNSLVGYVMENGTMPPATGCSCDPVTTICACPAPPTTSDLSLSHPVVNGSDLGKTRHDWAPSPPAFVAIGFEPQGSVYGSYVYGEDGTPTKWYAKGNSDVDDDGVLYGVRRGWRIKSNEFLDSQVCAPLPETHCY